MTEKELYRAMQFGYRAQSILGNSYLSEYDKNTRVKALEKSMKAEDKLREGHISESDSRSK